MVLGIGHWVMHVEGNRLALLASQIRYDGSSLGTASQLSH